MRSPESLGNGNPRGQNRRIGGSVLDAVEGPKAERLKRLEANERAKEAIRRLTRKLIRTAIATIAIASAVASYGHTTDEIMNTERARDVKEFQVESVFIRDPKIRSNPYVTGRGDKDNVLADLDNEGQGFDVAYRGVAYYYDNGDPNGPWIGLPADEFADALYEGSLISGSDADKIKKHEEKKESDNMLWMSGQRAHFKIVKEP